MRLFSHPGWWVHRLPHNNLEVFVGGPVRGRLHEDRCHRAETGQGHYPPVSMPWRLLRVSYGLRTAEDPFGYPIK